MGIFSAILDKLRHHGSARASQGLTGGQPPASAQQQGQPAAAQQSQPAAQPAAQAASQSTLQNVASTPCCRSSPHRKAAARIIGSRSSIS